MFSPSMTACEDEENESSCDFCDSVGRHVFLFDGCEDGISICAPCLRKALKLIEEADNDVLP